MSHIPPEHPLEMRERGFQMYAKRMTLPEIGVALAIPAATVAGWSCRGKWRARRNLIESARVAKEAEAARAYGPGATVTVTEGPGTEGPGTEGPGTCAPTASQPEAESRENSPEPVQNLTFEQKQTEFRDRMATVAVKAAREMAEMEPGELLRQAEKIAKLHATGAKALDLEKHKPAVVVNVGLLARPIRDKQTGAVFLSDDSDMTADEPLTLEMSTGCQPVGPCPDSDDQGDQEPSAADCETAADS